MTIISTVRISITILVNVFRSCGRDNMEWPAGGSTKGGEGVTPGVGWGGGGRGRGRGAESRR